MTFASILALAAAALTLPSAATPTDRVRPGIAIAGGVAARFRIEGPPGAAKTAPVSAARMTLVPDGAPVVTVGNDASCDIVMDGSSNTLQAAIDAAASDADGTDLSVIRLAEDGVYDGYTYTINIGTGVPQDIAILGGFADCSAGAPAAGEKTLIDGGNTGGGSLFRIGGNSGSQVVLLDRLTLTGGVADSGGGVLIENAAGTVVLSDTDVVGNGATAGGGIHVSGETTLLLLGETTVANNNASQGGSTGNGGGIYCATGGAAPQIFVDGPAAIVNNLATGDGGGIYSDGCSVNDFASLPGGIYGNVASGNGGGIYSTGGVLGVYGGETFATLLGQPITIGNAASPTSIDNNTAGINGGGIALGNDASASVLDAWISLNHANPQNSGMPGDAVGLGGGVFVGESSLLDLGRSLPGTRCHTADRCSRIDGNTATLGGGVAGYGSAGADISIATTYLEGNTSTLGGNAILVQNTDVGRPAHLRMEGNVVAANAPAPNAGGSIPNTISVLSHATATLGFNTFANNLAGAGDAEIVVAGTGVDVGVFSSIFSEPAGTVFGGEPFDADTTGQVDCLITFETASLPPPVPSGILVADPAFVDAANSDYHLSASSPAIDYCDTAIFDPNANDIDGDPRGIDDPDVVGVYGLYDLGADERVTEGGDAIFSDGFE